MNEYSPSFTVKTYCITFKLIKLLTTLHTVLASSLQVFLLVKSLSTVLNLSVFQFTTCIRQNYYNVNLVEKTLTSFPKETKIVSYVRLDFTDDFLLMRSL